MCDEGHSAMSSSTSSHREFKKVQRNFSQMNTLEITCIKSLDTNNQKTGLALIKLGPSKCSVWLHWGKLPRGPHSNFLVKIGRGHGMGLEKLLQVWLFSV